jgi:MFS family permease
MVDSIAQAAVPGGVDKNKISRKIILAAFFLGITTSIRVLGPLAGLLVFIYFLIKIAPKKNLRATLSPWLIFLAYGFIAIITMFITWPYLWENPISRFFEVLKLMSDNPTTLSVLFGGEVYRAGELPRRYFPFMLITTLTEPVWILFIIGLITSYWKLIADRSLLKTNKLTTIILTLLWLAFLVLYVLIRRPSMYDGLRHFLFILPPIFILISFAFEYLFRLTSSFWLRAGTIFVLILPGLVGIFKLHPYEYTYYNSFVGGTSGAFRNYETDYWLTCYKESVEQLEENLKEPFDLYVHREAYIAAHYADPNNSVHELRGAVNEVNSGDYVLVNTRTNEDRRVFKDAPTILQIGRGDAVFCVTKEIP